MSQVLILDGGLGTSLENEFSVKFDQSTPLWSSHLLVSDPTTLLNCQRGFGKVPVDVLLTATYQVSVEGFATTKTPSHPNGIEKHEIKNYIEEAVSIADKAKGESAKIALSIGPYGACMIPSQEYSGKYDDAHDSLGALQTWHRERLLLFAEVEGLASRIGYVALETMPRCDEIIAVRRALATIPELKDVPVWVSSLFPGDKGALPDGSTTEAAVWAMLDPSLGAPAPWGIGINCTKAWKLDSLLARYEDTVEKMILDEAITSWPALVLYPDGTNGEVYNTATQKWEVPDGEAAKDRSPWEEQVSQAVGRAQTRGQWTQILVGGCCRASSEDIAKLRATLTNATAA